MVFLVAACVNASVCLELFLTFVRPLRFVSSVYLLKQACYYLSFRIELLQWVITAAFMYRVANAMLVHEVDAHHNEYLESLMRHFKLVFALAGPIVFFVVDWLIPIRFLFRFVSCLL